MVDHPPRLREAEGVRTAEKVAEGRVSNDDRFKEVGEKIMNIFRETSHIRRSVCSFLKNKWCSTQKI